MAKALIWIVGALTATAALAADAPKWDVNTVQGEARHARFSTDEGTWMNVDVSPDGRTLVFDLLGDLYTLPISGGNARRITSGPAFDVQPRFSPDGSQISFTSDRGGGDNIWRAKPDGSDARAVTQETFRLLNNAVWTPDGQFLIARKHFTARRSLGAGEMWMYHAGAGGEGLQLTKKKNDQQDAGEPAVSPDGRYVYFSEDVSPGPNFEYNRDGNGTIYAIRRLDRESGELVDLVRIQGGAVRPQPSPDGKQLAFVRRIREKTALSLFDLETGQIRTLWDGLSHDQQEAWAIFGVYPNFNWTPDSRHIVIWAQGKLWRVSAADGSQAQIPFTAEVDQQLSEPVRASYRLEEGSFTPKMIRDAATSPDGRTLVFHAVGSLWSKRLPDGRPQRISSTDAFDYMPSFSHDGRQLVFVRYSDEEQSRIIVRDMASGRERVVSQRPGFYFDPVFSPDGRSIAYSKQRASGLIDYRFALDTGLWLQPLDGSAPRRLHRDGRSPQFSANGSRVYYFSGGGMEKKLSSIGIDGTEPREHFNLKYTTSVSISPDDKWVAFTELYNAYVAPMPNTGGAVDLNKDTRALPVARVSQDAGPYLHWSGNGSRLHWVLGDRYFTRELKDAFAFLPGAPATLPKPEDAQSVEIGLSLPLDTPSGSVAFTNARLVTMRGDEVIDNGTLVVAGDRIQAIGPAADVRAPSGARVIDLGGRTIGPGIIDVHAHASHFSTGPSPQANWAYYANLAYGITTMHDPSATSETVFAQSELVKAGLTVGPRVFSTGTILYGADGDFKVVVNSLDDARAHLRRLKSLGTFSVKSYNQPRRDQRQQINQAARELDMLVVMEGGSTFFHNLTMILDGSTSVEHNLPVAPLYKDVIQLWSATQVGQTPTLVVAYGGSSGENWWYQKEEVWKNEKLLRFFPREQIDARSMRRTAMPDEQYFHPTVAESVKALHDAGVPVQVGGHGQLQGLATHWEIWMLAQGGFTPHEALQAATINGARLLGLDRDLGSLEVGKRADLVVYGADPLQDIRNTEDIDYVMVNGRLFDGGTMAEIGGRQRPAPTFYWQRHGAAAATAAGIGLPGPTAECHCPKSATSQLILP
ncbi:amidohydrolase family protein [Pseudofulvimonas gallinarii]|uniref:Imidazolonepropionase-like amidohydrolase n=1 Tax=Pseudofulvimonas gallinarii TaxID=634155 RepID=A0A4R3LKI7_9GAMM|nr:amidohydrolase family protein [Pseudofulvimonas gallinarii]TCT00019.1 imidazolonepropionase-like amidohydrolase [Pseudofulvimonas gallinarii]